MKPSDFTPSPQSYELDLDDLLHPAQRFARLGGPERLSQWLGADQRRRGEKRHPPM